MLSDKTIEKTNVGEERLPQKVSDNFQRLIPGIQNEDIINIFGKGIVRDTEQQKILSEITPQQLEERIPEVFGSFVTNFKGNYPQLKEDLIKWGIRKETVDIFISGISKGNETDKQRTINNFLDNVSATPEGAGLYSLLIIMSTKSLFNEQMKKESSLTYDDIRNIFGDKTNMLPMEIRLNGMNIENSEKESIPILITSTEQSSFLEREKGEAAKAEERQKKREEEKEQTKLATIREESIRKAVEDVLKEIELEKLILGDRKSLSAKDEEATAKIREDQEKLDAMLNSGFNLIIMPKIIDSGIKSGEDRALMKSALKNGTLVITEGEITKIPKSLQRLGPELKAMERQMGVAWETTQKMTVTKVDTYIQAQTKEAKKNVIENNLALDLTKGQREDISKEMTKYTKDEKVINGIKEGNLIALNRMDDRTLDKLYNIMLKIGTEKENEIISERIGDLDAKMGKEKLAKSIEDKAKEMRIELSDKDRELIRDIRKGGIAENKEKALSQISGIMFEVMRDSKIVEARRVEELPKVG
jgi:hypothetical protein